MAYARQYPAPDKFIDTARTLVFFKGRDSHDYKFSSAVLEDYYHVSPAWRDRYLAASVFNLRGSQLADTPLAERSSRCIAHNSFLATRAQPVAAVWAGGDQLPAALAAAFSALAACVSARRIISSCTAMDWATSRPIGRHVPAGGLSVREWNVLFQEQSAQPLIAVDQPIIRAAIYVNVRQLGTIDL